MTEEEFTAAMHAIEPRPDGTGWSMLMQLAELCARRADEERAERARRASERDGR